MAKLLPKGSRKIPLLFEQNVGSSLTQEGSFYFHTNSNDRMRKSDLVSLSKSILAFSSQGRVEDARELFHRMTFRDSVTWNLMIRSYADNGKIEEARSVFDQMQCRNTVSWNTMILAYTRENKVHLAFKLFVAMPSKYKDIISWTTIINGLARMSQIDDSWRLFKQMPTEPNSIAWASIISGFRQNGLAVEALTLFKEMLFAGKKPTSHSLTSALTASADLSALTEGNELYCHVVKRGYQKSTHVTNAVISMFIKSGSLGNARIVFDEMPQRDMITWNSMIIGYGQHGLGSDSIMLVEQMQNAGFQPDRISFLGVLHACSHCGSIEEARKCFIRMEKDFGISPSTEHYACMVDLFSRGGMLHEAVDMIHKMPFEPTSIFWKSILNGCRIHRALGLGLYAAERVLELEPDNASVYPLVTEICEAVGRWEELEMVRKLRKKQEVRKELGFSWVEIKGKIHLFTPKDETHLQSAHVYELLKQLDGNVREESRSQIFINQSDSMKHHHLALCFPFLHQEWKSPPSDLELNLLDV